MNHYIKTSQIDAANERLQVIADRYPGDIYPYLKQLAIRACIEQQDIDNEHWETLFRLATLERNNGFDSVSTLNNIAYLVNSGYCNKLDKTDLVKLVDYLVNNREFGRWRSNLYEIAASLLMAAGNEQQMVKYIFNAGKYSKSVPHKIEHIKILLSVNRYDEAVKLFIKLKNHLAKHNRQALAWNRELAIIENEIKENQPEM